MTEEIVQSITEAEQQAAQIKEKALARAQEIIADAEAKAAEKEKTAQAFCKAYRESQLKTATQEAQKAYDEKIAQQTAYAQQYAEEILKKTDQATEIMGRIVNGSR